MAAVADRTASRKKKACVECRQQKMRCEGASDDGSSPCSRCRRLDVSCVFSSPFQRIHKRKRLQELESETSALKRERYSVAPAPIYQPNYAEYEKSTQTRSIDGLEVCSPIIDDCFELFFRDYHHNLPILDLSISPDHIYRKYPTLIVALSSRVTNRLLLSMNLRSKPMDTIIAFVLILSWPFTSGSIQRDPSFVLSGALIHIAMQCGLHTPFLSIESAKLGREFLETSTMKRAQVWAYVVITYQQLCCINGQLALMSFDMYNDHHRLRDILQQLPATLQLRLQLATILARAHKTFAELDLLSVPLPREQALDTALTESSGKIENIESNVTSACDRFYILMARQDIVAMHFFKSTHTLGRESCVSTFNTTVRVLEFVRDQEKNHALSSFYTRYVFHAALTGLSLLIRVLKSPFALEVDQAHGEALFHATTKFMQACSFEKGDLPEKAAMFFEKLWVSEKLFREADGVINITLRVRNRLSASPLHDLISRWREESRGSKAQAAESKKIDDWELLKESGNSSAPFAPRTDAAQSSTHGTVGPEIMLASDLWGDLSLDLDDPWGFFGSNSEWTA